MKKLEFINFYSYLEIRLNGGIYMDKFKEKRVTELLKKSPEEGISMAIDIYGPAVKTICTNILSNLEKEDIEEAI